MYILCHLSELQPRMTLVTTYLTHLTDTEKQAVVKRLLSDKTTNAQSPFSKLGEESSKCLPSVLQVLSAEPDFDKFAALKVAVDDEKRAELVFRTEGWHRDKANERTPALIKNLRPQAPGCILNWQPALNQFAGYFTRPTPAESSSGEKKLARRRGRKKTGERRRTRRPGCTEESGLRRRL